MTTPEQKQNKAKVTDSPCMEPVQSAPHVGICEVRQAEWMRAMYDIWREGGELARKNQRNITADEKADKSLVTETDLAISKLAQAKLAPFIKEGHLLLDEESIGEVGKPTQELIDKHDFIWALDPIDGTHSYAYRRPLYCISIGLIYKGTPLIGGVYMPATEELFLYDGQQALLMQKPFGSEVHTETLKPIRELSRYDFFDTNSAYALREVEYIGGTFDQTALNAAAVSMAYVAAGRACGSVFRASIWDMAGAWPLFNALGIHMTNIKTGEPIKRLTADLVDEKWHLKGTYICAKPDFFNELKTCFKA